jgi:cyanosortase A-associated protein
VCAASANSGAVDAEGIRLVILRLAILAVFVAAGIAILSQVLYAPPDRRVPHFQPPAQVPLAHDAGLSLQTNTTAGFNPPNRRPDRFTYKVRPSADATDVTFTVIFFASANADARSLPALAVPSKNPSHQLPHIPVTIHQEAAQRSWLEFQRDGDTFRAARISPRGICTITKAQLWRSRLAEWIADPAHILRWLFTSEPLVDRRALWLEMETTRHGVPLAAPEKRDAVWNETLAFFIAHPDMPLRGN